MEKRDKVLAGIILIVLLTYFGSNSQNVAFFYGSAVIVGLLSVLISEYAR